MHPTQNNIGEYTKVVRGTAAVAQAAGTVNGASIDRLGFDSCVLHHQTGAATGTPTSFTADAKIQHSDDGSTGWADFSGGAAGQLTAVNTQAEKNINLLGAKRYIRVVDTVAFTGGTSPTVGRATTVVLGGAQETPA